MRILHPQFRDENSESRYPFTDSSSLTSRDGLPLNAELFIDALLYPAGSVAPLHIGRIEVSGTQLTIVIVNNRNADVCSGEITLGAELDGTIVLKDEFDRPAGVLLADPQLLGSLQQFSLGSVEFDASATEFVASVVVPGAEQGVRGLGDAEGVPLTGDVWLVGEDGIVVRDVDGSISVDIVGEPLFRRRTCETTPAFTTPKFVKTINGISPATWGGMTLQVGRTVSTKPALRIYAENDELVIALAKP